MNNYYSEYGGLSVEEWVARYIYASDAEMERIRKTVDHIPDDAQSILDVGAGHGVFLKVLSEKRDIRSVGIEISEEKIAYARSLGVDMQRGQASKLPFPDSSFDVVSACEVIEHLPFRVYESALDEFVRVARKYVLVTVPFEEKRYFVECPYCGSTANPSMHLRSFKKDGLRQLLADATVEDYQLIGKTISNLGGGLRRRHRRAGWPQFLVCPSCGYNNRATESAGPLDTVGSQAASKPRGLVASTAKGLLSKIGLARPRWIMVLYRVRLRGMESKES